MVILEFFHSGQYHVCHTRTEHRSIMAQSNDRPWHLCTMTANAKMSGNCLRCTYIFFNTMNLLFTSSISQGACVLSNWTVMWCVLMESTVPIAPFTSPLVVSMFRWSMTRAPIAICRMASRPAVKLQSAFTFFISSLAFWVHLNFPVVSSTSSMHRISLVSAFNVKHFRVKLLTRLACWKQV